MYIGNYALCGVCVDQFKSSILYSYVVWAGVYFTIYGKHAIYEATLCPSTPGSMRWLYLKVHTLPVKEKGTSVFLDVKLRL
jgi:hypothetical protein